MPTPFIASFTTPPGQWQWGELARGARVMSASAEGDLFLAGELGGNEYSSAPFPLTDPVTTGAFTQGPSVLPVGFVTARLNGPTGLAPATARPRLSLWPNPAHHAVQLTGWPKGATSVRLLDGIGRVVLQQHLAGSPTAVTLALPAALAPGLYTVQCGGASQRLVVE